MFTFKDAYASKFYFDRYRVQQKYRFHWHYNILEAVIKNAYISQQVNVHAGNHKIKNILDMGCGNGHVLQFLAQTHRCNAVGFDPKADYKIKFLILNSISKLRSGGMGVAQKFIVRLMLNFLCLIRSNLISLLTIVL